jgi:hypothetical protein
MDFGKKSTVFNRSYLSVFGIISIMYFKYISVFYNTLDLINITNFIKS